MEKDPIKLVQEITTNIQAMDAAHKEVTAALKESVDNNTGVAKAALAKAEELASKVTAQANALVELEQKLGEKVAQGKAAPQTLGAMVIAAEGYKSFASGATQKFRIEANTITGQTGSPPANSNTLVQPERYPGIIPGAFRNLRIEDLLPSAPISSNSLEYPRETAFTNGASEVAEGDTKPQATLTFGLGTAPVRTVAHWLKVTKQIVEDAPLLMAYIDKRLTYGVNLRFDSQLLRGNGVGQNISGILASGNYTPFTPTAGENALDGVNRGIEAVEIADYQASGIIMHTSDWHAIERLKVGSTATDIRYVVGDPVGVIQRNLWGQPVVVTNACPRGTFVVGAFDQAYLVLNRSGVVVEMFEQDDVNVQKNLVTIRAERRGALASFLPPAVYAGLLYTGASR